MLALALVVASAGGCSQKVPRPSPRIGVLVSAQLQKPFTQIGEQFRVANPGSIVEFTFGLTPEFFTKVLVGESGVDVLATGDSVYMDEASQSGLLAGPPRVIASTGLSIVVAQGNPKKIGSFKELSSAGIRVAVCAERPHEPGVNSANALACGSALKKVEQATGVHLTDVSELPRSMDVLQKVMNGDADAGVLYSSDAAFAAATTVPFPEAANTVVNYSIAVLKGAKSPDLAGKFVDAVTGSGRSILQADGFDTP